MRADIFEQGKTSPRSVRKPLFISLFSLTLPLLDFLR